MGKFIFINALCRYLSADLTECDSFSAKEPIWVHFGRPDLCRTTAQVKPLQISAVQRHRSIFLDLCREKAAVWAGKAEVSKGADEGAGGFLVVLLKDLECSC